jgi:hypothetical protein
VDNSEALSIDGAFYMYRYIIYVYDHCKKDKKNYRIHAIVGKEFDLIQCVQEFFIAMSVQRE